MAKMLKASHLASVAGAAITLAALQPAYAQSGPEPDPQRPSASEITRAEDTVVINGIGYRDRTNDTAPVLSYGTDYIQPFEPLTVGDALKRVPSVTFLSDVLESDGVRLRGLDPAYTQILINGEKVPGAGSDSGAFGNGADGSFFVDRIPAELIERIEIVRSNSANRSGDAVAGAVNIVMRDAFSLDGGYVRAGAAMYDDGRVREILGGVWGGEVGGGRLLLGANAQGRRNPKEKFSLRYDEPGADLDNYEVQTDTRDGTDYSFNGSYQIDLAGGELDLSAFFVHTERTQDENSTEYSSDTVDFDPDTLVVLNNNDVDITQDSYSLNGGYKFDSFGGETRLKLGYSSFKDDTFEFEEEVVFDEDDVPFPDGDIFEAAATTLDVEDTEFMAKIEHTRELFDGIDIEFGLQFEQKQRDTLLTESETIEIDPLPEGTSWPPLNQTRPFTNFEVIDGGDNTIKQDRIDPYVMLSGDAGAISWEAGLRWENTEVSVEERTGPQTDSNDYSIVLPSAHIKWDLTDADRVTVSAAQTIRRPSFTFINPVLLEEALGDNDFQGDTTLDPETATGFDIGYERQIGRTGIAGINFFFRDVKDLLEVYNTGNLTEAYLDDFADFVADNPGATIDDFMDEEAPLYLYSARNTGDGQVWGIELDYSASLDFIGLPDTGLFANYSWLDSKIDDEFGERRFNSQSDYVYNVGFIHDFVDLDASFGVTYRKQGDALSRVVTEEVTTAYGGVLEVFVEKSFGDNFTVRFTGSNLTDGEKAEVFDKFDNALDQVARDYDEYEIETENAGPVFQLVGRYSF